jgi:hypothetical protein
VKVFVNGSGAIPIKEDAIIMWPVEDTGRNSVRPSTIANTTASRIDIYFDLKANWIDS